MHEELIAALEKLREDILQKIRAIDITVAYLDQEKRGFAIFAFDRQTRRRYQLSLPSTKANCQDALPRYREMWPTFSHFKVSKMKLP